MTEFLYAIGGVLPIAVIAVLIRRFFFPGVAARLQRNVYAVLCAWPVATVLGSFGAGEGGFLPRLQNIPDLQMAIFFGISAVIVVVLLFIGAAVGGSLSEKPDA